MARRNTPETKPPPPPPGSWNEPSGSSTRPASAPNGSSPTTAPACRSGLWAQACARLGVKPKHTRPCGPQTNGKVERFHRTLLEEWAYIRSWTSEQQRRKALQHYIHYYNHHRPHGALE